MKRLVQSHAQRLQRSAGALVVTALASGSLIGALSVAAGPAQASTSAALTSHYSFRTLNDSNDPTFNQLLGINDKGKIAGYFGSGAAGHPNKGYTLTPPYHQVNYRNQNFPGSRQTQVTGLNNRGVQVGFFSTQNKASLVNNNFGYYSLNGSHFRKVDFPTKHPASPPVDQLLGVNDQGLAVGFYTDSNGNNHGYLYDINSHRYFSESPHIPGVTSMTATGINDANSVVGFFTNSKGEVHGFFVRTKAPHLTILSVPGASATQPFGVNKFGEVVGAYTVGSGSTAVMHGFTWIHQHGFTTVDDPQGIGTTLVNGVNSAGDLVGFYVGKGGNTNGFLARP